MQTPLDKEKLLAGLQSDLEESTNQIKQSSLGRGSINEPSQERQFLPTAIRMKGKIVGQKELGDLHNLIKKSIDEIVNTSDRWSAEEKAKVKHELNDQIHNYSMDVLNKTLQFGSHLKNMELDEMNQEQSLGMWQNMMSGITAGIIGYGSKGQQQGYKPIADYTRPAGPTRAEAGLE